MECDVCKRDFPEWKLTSYFIGRKTKYMCEECKKQAEIDITVHSMRVAEKRRKELEK
jgi:hypothetical protein